MSNAASPRSKVDAGLSAIQRINRAPPLMKTLRPRGPRNGIAGRIRTRIVHRAGAASARETTARPDTETAGRSRTSAETRTGVATGMTTTPAARIGAPSAGRRATATALWGLVERSEGKAAYWAVRAQRG